MGATTARFPYWSQTRTLEPESHNRASLTTHIQPHRTLILALGYGVGTQYPYSPWLASSSASSIIHPILSSSSRPHPALLIVLTVPIASPSSCRGHSVVFVTSSSSRYPYRSLVLALDVFWTSSSWSLGWWECGRTRDIIVVLLMALGHRRHYDVVVVCPPSWWLSLHCVVRVQSRTPLLSPHRVVRLCTCRRRRRVADGPGSSSTSPRCVVCVRLRTDRRRGVISPRWVVQVRSRTRRGGSVVNGPGSSMTLRRRSVGAFAHASASSWC